MAKCVAWLASCCIETVDLSVGLLNNQINPYMKRWCAEIVRPWQRSRAAYSVCRVSKDARPLILASRGNLSANSKLSAKLGSNLRCLTILSIRFQRGFRQEMRNLLLLIPLMLIFSIWLFGVQKNGTIH